jgi:hypothetical protein
MKSFLSVGLFLSVGDFLWVAVYSRCVTATLFLAAGKIAEIHI